MTTLEPPGGRATWAEPRTPLRRVNGSKRARSAAVAARCRLGSTVTRSACSASIAETPTWTSSHSLTSATRSGWSNSTVAFVPLRSHVHARAPAQPKVYRPRGVTQLRPGCGSLVVDDVHGGLLGAGAGAVDAPVRGPQLGVLVVGRALVLRDQAATTRVAHLTVVEVVVALLVHADPDVGLHL